MIKFDKNFKSSIDKFLEAFDKQHPEKSLSQQQEIKKYSRITELRDLPVSQYTTGKIWKNSKRYLATNSMAKNFNVLQNLSFTKMQALGNDFIVLNGTKQKINLPPKFIQQLADRHFGIGFDQILLLEPPINPKADFYYRVFNADGTEVSQCGNGLRCVARFAREYGLTSKRKLTFETHHGMVNSYILKGNIVRVNMGIPQQTPIKIPFIAKTEKTLYSLPVNSLKKKFNICALALGNPHCILWIKSFANLTIEKVGGLLSKHPRFPDEANVSFTKIDNRHTISIRVFERGVGETLACGSAACAAMVASKLLNLVDNQVDVLMKGGKLIVQWDGQGKPVWLTGPAEFIFDGKITNDLFVKELK